jgi:hypothetical protein
VQSNAVRAHFHALLANSLLSPHDEISTSRQDYNAKEQLMFVLSEKPSDSNHG